MSLENHEDRIMDTYPFTTLWINGRRAFIEKVVQGAELPRSDFEESTFDFIRQWLQGKEAFDMVTSGSTGEPKTITVTRRQMVMSASKTAEKIQLQKNDAALVCIDTKYIGGKMMLVRSLVMGMPILALDPAANPLAKIPIDKRVQFTALVPYQIREILESKHPHLLNNPNKVLVGGAPLRSRDAERLAGYQCEFYETYGMTETVSHIALRLMNTQRKQQYFEVLPGVTISSDDRGCLIITSDHLEKPVVTNDLVEIVGEGRFLWLGRFDRTINSGGVKVHPEKIEQALDRIFGEAKFPHRFFIAALPDDKLGNRVVLILEGVQNSSEVLIEALRKLKASLTPYEFPKEAYTIGEFRMTRTQKIDQRQTLAGVSLLPLPKI